MRMPRNLSGMELVVLLRRRYGYRLTRQTGSHMRLVGDFMGYEHHVSVPRHSPIRVGTLNRILGEIAEYLEMNQGDLMRELFNR